MYMSALINFRRILLSPKGAEGGGGKKPTPKGDEGGKAAAKGKVAKAAPKTEADDDEIDYDDDTDELGSSVSDEDEADDDLEEADADEDEEAEDDEKRAHRPKVKDKGKEKGVKPKLVSISDKELRELKRKAGEAETAAQLSEKRKDQIAREREDKKAAKDGA
jgi:hypothetical protein